MKHESISSKAPKLDARFNSLNLEEQLAIAREKYLSEFATGLEVAQSNFHAEITPATERLHEVVSALKNSEQLDLELAAVERSSETGIIEIEAKAIFEIDRILHAGGIIRSSESLQKELSRKNECISQAEDDKKQARRLLEKATRPKWPVVSRRGFWTMALIASSLILGTDLLFARFVSLSQTELMLVLVFDVASVLALALTPKEHPPVIAPKFSTDLETPAYETQPAAA